MRYEDTEFVTMFRKFGGIKRVIMSIDFQLSLALGITFSVVTCYYGITKVIIAGVSPIFVTVSAAMIAIAIAGLAIIVSMSDPEFIKVLKHVGIYNNLLFMFWYSTIISGLSIIINTLSYAMQCITNENLYLSIFFLMSIFLVLYSIFSVILLVGTTMRYGLYRGAFIEQEKKGKKSNKT